MESIDVFQAMQFAKHAHGDQLRKYTNEPYWVHLAEVTGIVATVDGHPVSIAVAWLHDVIEDSKIPDIQHRLIVEFPERVWQGVSFLTDIERGNRKERNELKCIRLNQAPGYIQTIKVADLISNSKSILQHDPKFAKVYIPECRAMLKALDKADDRLIEIADRQIWDAESRF